MIAWLSPDPLICYATSPNSVIERSRSSPSLLPRFLLLRDLQINTPLARIMESRFKTKCVGEVRPRICQR